MRKRTILLAIATALLVATSAPAWADHVAGFVGMRGDLRGTGIIIFGDELVKKLTEHDLLFIRLGLRREFFRSLIPQSHASPVVVVPRTAEHTEELDRLIHRLGELIRDMEQSEKPQ